MSQVALVHLERAIDRATVALERIAAALEPIAEAAANPRIRVVGPNEEAEAIKAWEAQNPGRIWGEPE